MYFKRVDQILKLTNQIQILSFDLSNTLVKKIKNLMINCCLVLLIVLSFVVSSYCASFDEQDDEIIFKDSLSNEESASEQSVSIAYKTSINDLPGHVLFHISSFFKNQNPYENISQINWHCFHAFHGEFSLKQIVINRFDIPEFEFVDENEPELFSMLKLSWCSDKAFVLFACLMEDLVKKSYKVLSRPLILHVHGMFLKFTFDQQLKYIFYLNNEYSANFADHLANICGYYGHYDLAFEYLQDDPKSLVKVFSKIENRQSVMEFFKSNPQNAIKHGLACLEGDRTDYSYACLWVAQCLIYDAPVAFYTELLSLKPIILKHMERDLFHSIRIPESEYPRIHAQMKELFHVYLLPVINRDFAYYDLINDLRLGVFGKF